MYWVTKISNISQHLCSHYYTNLKELSIFWTPPILSSAGRYYFIILLYTSNKDEKLALIGMDIFYKSIGRKTHKIDVYFI